jgi:hypothetical protein
VGGLPYETFIYSIVVLGKAYQLQAIANENKRCPVEGMVEAIAYF